ncbi:MAG: hypothetical protein QXQ02_09375 [Halobacteria archaeon]
MGSKIKASAILAALFLALLFTICPGQAYVYYVEAESYDPDNSKPVVGACIWSKVADKTAYNESYIQYNGPHAGALTSLLYPIPNVSDSNAPWFVWVRCIMPDTGSDSYFFYVSNDGGQKWGPQQTAHGGGIWQEWKWQGWSLITPLEKGKGNVLKISERENAKADVICVRNDGVDATDEEYEKWQQEHKTMRLSVDPLSKMVISWGYVKSGY